MQTTEHESYFDVLIIDEEPVSTQAFAATCSAHTLIAFRGSQEEPDFYIDATFPRTSYISGAPGDLDDLAVHSGFMKALHSAGTAEKLVDFVRDNGLHKPIFVCGHSLGGALAVLTAALLQRRLGCQVHLYTYGQPRVGDDDFAHYFAERFNSYYRFQHDGDVVPHVPVTVGGPVPVGPLALQRAYDSLQNHLFGDGSHDMDDWYCHFGARVDLPSMEHNTAAVDDWTSLAGEEVRTLLDAANEIGRAAGGDPINHSMDGTYMRYIRRYILANGNTLTLSEPARKRFLRANRP